jgi:hypothetical protein
MALSRVDRVAAAGVPASDPEWDADRVSASAPVPAAARGPVPGRLPS